LPSHPIHPTVSEDISVLHPISGDSCTPEIYINTYIIINTISPSEDAPSNPPGSTTTTTLDQSHYVTTRAGELAITAKMFGSYGSSSSSSSSLDSYTSRSSYSMSSPMDIAPRSSSRRGPDVQCAFPSWPRRSSLGEDGNSEERATSYITDDELFMDVFDDDACSVSSQGSNSPAHSPAPPVLTEAQFLQLQREQLAYQREMRRIALAEKELRRRQAEQDQQRRRQGGKRRSGSASSKKPKSKLSAMTTIAEAE